MKNQDGFTSRLIQNLNRLFKADTKTEIASAYEDELKQANTLASSGEIKTAYQLCRDIIKSTPSHLPALLLAADLAEKLGDVNEALGWLNTGSASHPANAELQYRRGRLFDAVSDHAAAAEAFASAVTLSPNFARAHNSLGAALQILGRMDEAFDCFKHAHRLDPELWQASYNIGNFYKLNGHLDQAIEPFQDALHTYRKPGTNKTDRPRHETLITRSKLVHDIEQLHYLNERSLLDNQGHAAMHALERVQQMMEPHLTSGLVEFPATVKPLAAPYFNRLINFYNAPALPGGALNPDQDWQRIEADYFSNAPGMTYIDHFLKPEALASLRRFCLESTIWFDYLYNGGYVGCTCEDGFICPLLTQIAEEQCLALPGIFGDHKILGLWGYKYDSKRSGISPHADFAAVNVNFWLAPDDANLNPQTGGLVIWDKEAPLDWDFKDFNTNEPRIMQFLEASGARPFVVPHKQNRAVLFNSDLFHKTDSYHFKPGYENRRINVTMLYGDRQIEKIK
jgi:tetratricopeptide (TPR) repeat protein